jgi:hypothetical protein
MEAKELARHADIRETAKYTHIGMAERAEALAGLPSPNTSAFVALSEIRRVSGGVLGQEVSPGGSNGRHECEPENEKTPSTEGVSSFPGTDFKNLPVDLSSGGGGNCTRVPRSFGNGLYVRSRSFVCQPRGPDRQGPLRLIPS